MGKLFNSDAYAVGMYNGDGTNNLNADDDFMYVMTATAYPLTNKEKNVYIHASVMLNETSFRNNGAQLRMFFPMRGSMQHAFGGTNANGVARNEDDTKGRQVGVSVAARYWKNNLRIEGEFLWLRFNREQSGTNIPQDLSPLDLWGAYGGISYFIALGDPEKHMGLEPLFKVSYTNIDDSGHRGGRTTRGQQIWEYTAGFKFHLNQHVYTAFNWVMYDLEEAQVYSNKIPADSSLIHAFIFQFCFKW